MRVLGRWLNKSRRYKARRAQSVALRPLSLWRYWHAVRSHVPSCRLAVSPAFSVSTLPRINICLHRIAARFASETYLPAAASIIHALVKKCSSKRISWFSTDSRIRFVVNANVRWQRGGSAGYRLPAFYADLDGPGCDSRAAFESLFG